MNKTRFRRNLIALIVIIIAAIIVLLSKWYYEVNKYHDIADMNSFRWQMNMNIEEFTELEKGMSYLEVVEVAKGEGEPVNDGVYIWKDELLLTQVYEIHFQDGNLKEKRIVEKRGNSTR
ncbi:hypothetical protein [Ureibacillus aquaedulcis]|uniref:Uncharacterized protein n=1 Tax=Ureibacillus aquaedulcis TaxID=3058421 RepID=A0ABT8GU97_9BACL|nr:hypothetical protein [Ureibacillus sp. BA0131]MDN4494998.1 hypothetical protein [Ureibacillus sp. BA0131]